MTHSFRTTTVTLAATTVTIVFIALITVIAELALPLKDWLKNTFSHHWIGKSLLSLLVFAGAWLASYLTQSSSDLANLIRRVRLLSILSILMTLLIFGFFIYETIRLGGQ